MASLSAAPSKPVEIRISGEVLFRDVGGEAVILDLRSGQYFGLNEIGNLIWSMVARRRPLEEIVEALLAEYDTSADRVRADLGELIDRLLALGLLNVTPPETRGTGP
jgi:hypothetical protein